MHQPLVRGNEVPDESGQAAEPKKSQAYQAYTFRGQ